MLLVTKPMALIKKNDVCPLRQNEVVTAVGTNVAEIICEKILFTSRTSKFAGCNETLLTLEVFNKVRNGVEGAQQYVKRNVIQDVNEAPFWVNLTDGERASRRWDCKATIHQIDVILAAEKMIITYEIGTNH